MLTIKPKTQVTQKIVNVTSVRLCPDCQAPMSEVDRITENGTSFIWYECSRQSCDGQWLEKKSAKMGVA